MSELPPVAGFREKKKVPLEVDIESPVCAYARRLGFYVRKYKNPNHRAAPDRIFINPRGVTLFIEFKRPGEKPTEKQLDEGAKIMSAGGFWYWCDNVNNGKQIINAYRYALMVVHGVGRIPEKCLHANAR